MAQAIPYNYDLAEPIGLLVQKCLELVQQNKDSADDRIEELKDILDLHDSHAIKKTSKVAWFLNKELGSYLNQVVERSGYKVDFTCDLLSPEEIGICLRAFVLAYAHPIAKHFGRNAPASFMIPLVKLRNKEFHLDSIASAYVLFPDDIPMKVPTKDIVPSLHKAYLEMIEEPLSGYRKLDSCLSQFPESDQEKIKQLVKVLFPRETNYDDGSFSQDALDPTWRSQLWSTIEQMKEKA
jgi:hypothetical protein